MAERTAQAIKACGYWLAECMRLGWSRDKLDALEALWWEHHDERGNLKPAGSAGNAGVSETSAEAQQARNGNVGTSNA